MAIEPGEQIRVDDFVETSAGAADSGKSVKLDADGKIDGTFLSGDVYIAEAGEDLSERDAAYISDGSEAPANAIQQDSSNSNLGSYFRSNSGWILQSFRFPSSATFTNITKIQLYLSKTGAPTGSITLTLYADDGSDRPTGSALATATVAYSSIAAGPALVDFTFSSPFTATPNTKYVIVADPGGGTVDGSNRCEFNATNSSVIEGTVANSGNSGASWTNGATADGVASGGDLRFRVVAGPTAGLIYKTDASDATYTHNWLGFVKEAANAGEDAPVYFAGVVSGFSGLTPGATYYLSDTAGEIASSAGSTSRKVGLALTATELLIKNDNI